MKKHILFILIIVFSESCGLSNQEIQKIKEQKIKDSIYSYDSLAKEIKNKKLVDSILAVGIPKNPTSNSPYATDYNGKSTIQKNEKTIQEIDNASSPNVTYSQAERFMRQRCENANQELVDGKIVKFNNTRIYTFLTRTSTSSLCICGISEHVLSIISCDCGGLEKLVQFRGLQ
jgi:hypothetical protein